jgi:hypothetical protein
MSTVIMDGYKFKKKLTLEELQKISMKLRKEMYEVSICICEKLVARRVVDILDTAMARGWEKVQNKYGESRISMESPIISEAFFDLWKEYKRFRQNKEFYLDANFDCRLVVFPLKRKTLALFLSHHNEYKEAWMQTGLIDDYHYQNQTDKPIEISTAKWNTRKKDWDEALPGLGIPSMNGIIIELVNQIPHLSDLNLERMQKHIPNFEDRVMSQAKDIVFSRVWLDVREKNSEIEDEMDIFYKVHRWIRSKEGQKEVEEEAKKVCGILKDNIEPEEMKKSLQDFLGI